MAVYTLTLAALRARVQFKLRDDTSPTQVDNWINDVVQHMTEEVFFDEMYVEDVQITGDGAAQAFDLPEDFRAFVWMYSAVQDRPLEEVSPREMTEDWSPFDESVQTPQVYTTLGRTGTAGANTVPTLRVKFDTIPTDGEEIEYAYYRLHPLLDSDADVILLPQALLSTIVDGVLMESDAWNDSDQFSQHRDRFLDRMNQLKRNQNRRPNRRRTMGRSEDSQRRRVPFPPNYPSV